MKKNFLLACLACSLAAFASAQTLFTYGKYSVDAKEFLRAYNKNNSTPVVNKAKSITDYLQLYINSRLKIQEAYARGYDTLPNLRMEVANLRTQIAENYMNDPQETNRLTREAFQRSLKDIRVAHIFISFRDAAGQLNEAAAESKKNEVLAKLAAGGDFSKIAAQFSDDAEAKKTNGELGYITVFTLPYQIENIIYSTPVGKYAEPLRSRAGYHIFKNMAERKAVGRIKAQQILLAIPPGADDVAKKQIAARADSLYKRLVAGENFNRLAAALSNDYISAANGGTMPDISVGQYDPVFESVLWSLAKDGAMSKPFQTTHGWHIVKRTSIKPVITDGTDKNNNTDLQQRVMSDPRWKSSKDFIFRTVKEKAGFKKYPYNDEAMWAMTDSVLDLKPMKDIGRTIVATTPMFAIGDSTYTATTWVNYANTYRFKQDGTGAKPHSQVRDEFEQFALLSYYRDHLEDFNPDFRDQMIEFRDGNLFFEIMQQEIWNRAQLDSAELLALYEKNKQHYLWKKSVDAVLFFCADEITAKALYDELKKNPTAWRKALERFSEKVVADSSRYEWEQIPNLHKMTPKAGMITTPLVNQSDKTASLAYIIQAYTQPLQRSFTEARGLVINDYQLILEQQWNEELRKKYPVVIDQKVLADISR
jgi:peptidyl-prolyl cis-trans isomerase SurA